MYFPGIMSSETGDNSNDDNDLEVASVLAGVLRDNSGLNSTNLSNSSTRSVCSIESIEEEVVHKSDPPQNFCLQILAAKGELAAIKKIILQNPHHPEFVKGLPLIPASRNNWLKLVRYLLQQGCPVDAKGDFQTTALHQACAMGNYQVVDELLNYKSDVNLQCANGNTPLHYAIHSKNIDCLQLLLLDGADTKLINLMGQSPLDLAFKINDHNVENIFQLYLLNSG